MIRQAQKASEILGWTRTCEICGSGGLSGATFEELQRLIAEAGLEDK